MKDAARQLALFGDTEEPGTSSGFSVRPNKRARRLSIKVFPRGRVEVVVPPRTHPEAVQAFVDDQILCLKPKGQGIYILAADGSEIGQFAADVKKPSSMHVGDNTVAVLAKNKLYAYKHDGSSVFSIGRYGSSGGGFKDPSDVYIHGGLYYVSDSGNNRVQVFSGDGQFLEEVKAGKGDDRLFIEVGPVAVDSQQNLYVADGSELGLIHVIDKERNKIGTIGDERESIHKPKKFYALEIDKQDRLYVLGGSDYSDY